MNKNSKVVKMPEGVKPGTSKKELKEPVTRGEFIDILTQISNNINQMTQYQMDDMNALYAQHLFPNEIKMAVLEDIVMDKLGVTEEELREMYNTRLKAMEEQARELKAKAEAEAAADKVIEGSDDGTAETTEE